MDLSEWTRVCLESELQPGEYKVVDADGTDVAVFNLEGKVFAIEDVCTHDGAQLTGGPVEGCEIVCPRHGARFCIKTGAALTPPAYEDTAVISVHIHQDAIYVRDDRWD